MFPSLLPLHLPPELASFRPEHLRLATASRDEAVAQISGRLSPYRLRLLGTQETFTAQYLEAQSLAGVGLSTLAFGTEVELDIHTADDHLLVTTQVSGHSTVASQGRKAQGGAGFIVVDSTPHAVTKRFSADSCRVNVRIPRTRLDAAWASLTGALPVRPLVFQPFPPDAAAGQRWLAHVRLLMTYGLQAERVPERQAEALTESALLALLMEFPHDQRPVLEAPVARAGQRTLQTAMDFIQDCRHEPLRLADIAAHCGVSVRSLTEAFRSGQGTSPMKFLQETRLQAARTLLTSRQPGMTVARAATDNGFTALGRFAALYAERFGEAPSQTLARR
ncbi:AraC family transcriptional regulator [Achromobacter sp. GG226]|uniref:AraC family transcriptional regulator n=1 Tax=Verticiella alkaliphila TaxID=2779529 RepID=UPI001C0BFE2C|nr:AraC family transcriptional regulator [Verticiella sp. GG226]